MNLVVNAINYTMNGEVMAITDHKGEQVILTIRDTGVGIAAEDLPLIFERFYRSESARSITQGTGLGLSIVKELVERYGGKIEVESAVGEGSTFRISFPTSARF